MHNINLEITNEQVYQNIMFFLKHLNVDGLKIKEEQKLDFSDYKIDSFKNLDPVKFQNELRDEWK